MSELLNYLKENIFYSKVEYVDAAELCLALYSSIEILPTIAANEKSTESISMAFCDLSKLNLIAEAPTSALLYYGLSDKTMISTDHWIEIMHSITRKGISYNFENVEKFLSEKIKLLVNRGEG